MRTEVARRIAGMQRCNRVVAVVQARSNDEPGSSSDVLTICEENAFWTYQVPCAERSISDLYLMH